MMRISLCALILVICLTEVILSSPILGGKGVHRQKHRKPRTSPVFAGQDDAGKDAAAAEGEDPAAAEGEDPAADGKDGAEGGDAAADGKDGAEGEDPAAAEGGDAAADGKDGAEGG